MNKSLVDLAYEFLLKRKQTSFKEVYDYVKTAKEIPLEEESKEMVNLYTDMVLDNRFLLIKDDEWSLRENYKFEEIKKKLDSLVLTSDDNLNTTKFEAEEIAIIEEEYIDDDFDDLHYKNNEDDSEIDWDEVEKEMEENN